MSEDDPLPASEFGTPFYALVEHFSSNGFNFRADNERKLLTFCVSGEAAEYNCALYISHDDEVLQIQIDIPVAARNARFRAIATEFVARANHRLVVGRFDLDVDKGQFRYHVGHPFGERLVDETIGRLMGTALATADRYFPALMRVLYGGHTPADAVYLSELDMHAEAMGDADVQSTPSPGPQKPAAKRPRRQRKDPRSKTTGEFPGLFDEKPREDDPRR